MKMNIGFLAFLLIILLPIKVYGSSESLLIVLRRQEILNLVDAMKVRSEVF